MLESVQACASEARCRQGNGGSISWGEVVKLLQSSHDVRDYLRTCWRRLERNLPIIVYARVSNFSHSYASHSFTLSCLAGLVEDEHLKLVGSLAFLGHVLAVAPMRLRFIRRLSRNALIGAALIKL